MKDCRFTRTSRFLKWCALLFYPAVALLIFATCVTLVVFAFRNKQHEPFEIELLMSAMGLLLLWFLIRFSFNSYRFESRKYSISQSGIQVSSAHKQIMFIPWEKINGICVTVFNGTASLQSYQKVICCFISPEPPEFQSKILRGYCYAIRNYEHFIVIDYTKSEYNALTNVYSGEIIDYSNEQLQRNSI